MALPNVLLLGVGKAGTTSMYHYVRQHPQAAVSSIREPKFLMYAGHLQIPIRGKTPPFKVLTREAYEALYSGYEDRMARMDISPSYFVFPEQSILGIRQYVPEAKMIVIYRQPADRGYSNYLMHVRMGDEPLATYAEALEAEQAGLPRTRGQIRTYFDRGLYLQRTKRFLESFPREKFLFMLYDDLVADQNKFLEEIFTFLGIQPGFRPDTSRRHNAGAWPRSLLVHRLVTSMNPVKKSLVRRLPPGFRKSLERKIHAVNLNTPPKLDRELRRELTRKYREDILGLQDLLGRDLSPWMAER
jgi:hypothetical protein